MPFCSRAVMPVGFLRWRRISEQSAGDSDSALIAEIKQSGAQVVGLQEVVPSYLKYLLQDPTCNPKVARHVQEKIRQLEQS